MSFTRIMIVENESAAAGGLQASLEKSGHTVAARVSRGLEAVQLAGQKQPDLVLMELHLETQLDGLQAAEQIRALYGIPVILTGSQADAAYLEQTQLAEPNGYILRPFEERELNAIISLAQHKLESQRRLRESEARYDTLFNIMAQGVVYQDSRGEIISANQAAARILGLSQADMLGRSSWDPRWRTIREDGSALPAEEHPGILALRTGREVSNVIMGVFQPQKDEYVWINAHASPHFEDGGKEPTLVVTTFEDVTDIKKYEHGLKASETLYRSLVETSPDGVTLTDLQGHFLAANRQSLFMLGFNRIEDLQASGLTSFDFVSGPAWLCEQESLKKALLESSPRRVEYTFLRRDGSSFPADASLSMLLDAADQPYAFLAISRDISERKEGEAQLRKLSQAVVQSADNIIITNTEGVIEYANPQFEKTTGYSLAEVIGQNPRILKSGEQSLEFYRQMWLTIKSGQIWRGELHNRRKDGSLYWEEASIAPVADETGKVTNFVAIKKEITERKEMEQALRIKESAISSSINAIALADLEGRLTYVNPALLRLWGYASADEVLGASISDFWREEPLLDSIIHQLSHGRGWQGEMTARRKDGSLLEVDVSAHIVMDGAGRPLCMMSSFVDITARKLAEAAEREERLLAEALRLTAEALGSSLKLDDVLELILENAGKVIANDAMTIMLLDGQALKVVRHRGYTERGLKEYIENTGFKIEDFPSLRVMVESRQPSIIPDVRGTQLWEEQTKMEWIRSYAGVPITRREQVIGFLNLDSATPNFFTPAHANRLKAFASQAAVAIENARLYEQDHILSITDGLTGLYNSRYFFELAKLEFERSHRYLNDLSIVMVDVDYFKQVNDTFGHLVGDDVLREMARRVRTCLRVVDIAARYGGEEFVILMAQTGECEAWQAAERIRCAVADAPFEVPEGQPISITISLGVVTLANAHQNLNMLVKSADDALYSAKYAGRNRIAVWKSPE